MRATGQTSSGLDQTTGLAARRCGGAFSQARLQHGADADLSAAHVTRGAVVCAGAVCGAAHGVGAFYGKADTAPLAHNAIWFAVLLVGQWALGAVMQGRIGMLMALMLQSAALATATSALGFTEWHWLFKPLTMVLLLFLVAASAYSTSARGLLIQNWLLLAAALAGSLAGDVFLMFQGFFIPGLVSFLVAHLFYVALFKRGQVWFPHRGRWPTLALAWACTPFCGWRPAPACACRWRPTCW